MKKKKVKKCSFQPDQVVKNILDLHNRMLDNVSHVVDPESYNFYRKQTSSCLLKKYTFSSDDADVLHERAINKFLSVNSRLEKHNIQSIIDCADIRSKEKTLRVLARTKEYVHQILGDFETDSFFYHCRHSSGTSQGLKYQNTGLTAKMGFPLSSTRSAAMIFNMYLMWDPNMRSAYQARYPEWRFSLRGMSHIEEVFTSRMTSVPKNNQTNRTIAIEPTVNMFLQQGVGRYMQERLKSFGIDIEQQQFLHHDLAFSASVTNALSTVDFASASDSVHERLVRYLLPPKWMWIVDKIRCSHITIDKKGVFPLSCISTMGNATTFPLETLVFFTLAMALSQDTNKHGIHHIDESLKPCVTVFGDDVILPTEFAADYIKLCEQLGFEVNHEKSFFHDEYFRESCGHDYFHGRNVRGLYLTAPRSLRRSVLKAWLYNIINGFLKKQISCFGPLKYLYISHELFAYLFSLLWDNFDSIEIVPASYPDDSGLKIAEDFQRFYVTYPMRKCHVKYNKNNTLRFLFLKSVSCLNEEASLDNEFHYWQKLKNISYNANLGFVRVDPKFEVLKKEGGYVMASGLDLPGVLQECLGTIISGRARR